MLRQYPVKNPTSAPSSGNLLYQHLLRNISVPAKANHEIWYSGEKAKLRHPEEYAFRGNIPTDKTLELITLSGQPIIEREGAKPTGNGTFIYTLRGTESPILVKDLSDSARAELKIPAKAKPNDKVYNPNFKEYQELEEYTRFSNELACLSVPKSISSYFGGNGRTSYSERDVLDFLTTCFKDLSSTEMMHVLHGNHLAWAALNYVRNKGNVEGEIMVEFHAQNPTDFYMKDLGTVLPTMFYALANLGKDPVMYHDMLDIEVYGAKPAAEYMQSFMPK